MRSAPQGTNGLRPRWSRRLGRVTAMLGGALAVSLVVAACGSPSTPGVATGSTTSTTDSHSTGGSTPATGPLAYAACMRSHGVPNFPDPDNSGNFSALKNETLQQLGVTSAQLRAADSRCVHLLPPGEGGNPLTVQQQQDYLRAAACMRSNGITNFPDPVFSGGSVNFPIPSSINTHSTRFTQADQTCRKLIPAGLPYAAPAG